MSRDGAFWWGGRRSRQMKKYRRVNQQKSSVRAISGCTTWMALLSRKKQISTVTTTIAKSVGILLINTNVATFLLWSYGLSILYVQYIQSQSGLALIQLNWFLFLSSEASIKNHLNVWFYSQASPLFIKSTNYRLQRQISLSALIMMMMASRRTPALRRTTFIVHILL